MSTSGRIRDVRLENFKAFRSLTLSLPLLTVLTGTNSSGKSSVMQALALLEQSRDQHPPGLVLNGDLVELGSFEDVLFDRIELDKPNNQSIGIATRGTEGSWQELSGTAASKGDFVPLELAKAKSVGDRLPWRHLTYIRADRIGPTLLHQKSYSAITRERNIGPRGEFAAHFLLSRRDMPVDRALCIPGAPVDLEDQVGAWLERLSVDTRFYVSDVEATGTAVMSFSNGPVTGLSSGRIHRSTNVGFGLSYSLPIIVACLISRPGDILLIENPEAHLHPRGQAVLAGLCALTAQTGAQVIIETHNDHVLNRVRIAVAEEVLRPTDIALYYFRREAGAAAPTVSHLDVGGGGQIDNWPAGFFDEYMNALLKLNEYD